jgi:hypothetical protein
MCNFFSGILTKDGKTLYDLDIDDHRILMEKFVICDKKPLELRTWIKFEITPKDGNVFNKKKSNWIFKVDEERKIEWVSDRMIRNAYAALKTVLEKRVLDKGTHTINEGRWFFGGSSTVEAYNSSTVKAYGSSTVEAYGSSTVEAYDSSTVKAYNSSTVEAYNSSTVEAYDSSTVKAYGSSTVEAYDSSIVIEENDFVGKASVSGNAQQVKRK